MHIKVERSLSNYKKFGDRILFPINSAGLRTDFSNSFTQVGDANTYQLRVDRLPEVRGGTRSPQPRAFAEGRRGA
jgi:hypothetical protein